jgi:nucleotide-binding universal stress UspA family protein
MIKSVLVHLRGTRGDTFALSAALQVARPFSAHLECLHVRPNLAVLTSRIAPAMIDDSDAVSKIVEKQQKEAAEAAQRALSAFGDFCAHERIERSEFPPAGASIGGAFREDIGDELDHLIAHGRRHDLVVVKGGPISEGGMGLDDVGRLLLGAGRPVLLAPNVSGRPVKIVVVAWKDTPESARAVTAAMPILKLAKRVYVLNASEDEEKQADANGVVHHLQWHGIAAEAHHVEPRGRSAYDAVLETARAAEADLLVAGAYGRSRLSEIVFGGFTEGLLEDASLPVLFQH